MYRVNLIGAGLLAACLASAPAMAQQQQQPPCSTEEYRQLDFWVGEWNLTWVDQDGNPQSGTNTITRELGDCMIMEQFDGTSAPAEFVGRSMSMYVPDEGGWKQLWMDNYGGYLPFTGGPDDEGFMLMRDRPREDIPWRRMIWRNITEDELDWHWQGSEDEGETWSDLWHIHYTRAE